MKTSNKLFFAFAAAIALAAGHAQAQLVNGDFEAATIAPWVQVQGGGNALVVDNGPSLPGIQAVELANPTLATADVLQQVAVGYGPGVINWSFDIKPIAFGIGGVAFVQIFAETLAGQIDGQSGLQGPLFDPIGVWTTHTGSFVAGPTTQQIVVEFQATNGAAGAGTTIRYDNFIIVPEPSTYALLGVGCAGLLALRRRK